MNDQTGQKIAFSILTIASLLLPAQHIGAAPEKRNKANTEANSGGRIISGGQWKAHPEKGWVRSGESDEQRDTNKQNPKRANGKLRGNRADKQN
jgi:hypothetical protein